MQIISFLLIKVSSPDAIKKQTTNSVNEPIPFNVFIRFDLLPIIFLIPNTIPDETMMKKQHMHYIYINAKGNHEKTKQKNTQKR